ncbi:FecCD family ABC transporter permease [Nocardia alba]|uniref:Iron complex transport system permease protein n=1 Tax=Nocardia alba TaxID=225051 RepID=A0A4V2PC21_9NOCA|nr:iron chelate uptake ABC transporter family permease subunit [Nocardia alba]TCJ99615.1 iron complex transport system permease protein [Nocardia alba]
MSRATVTAQRTPLSRTAVLLTLVAALIILLAGGLFVGSGDFTVDDAWRALFNEGGPTTLGVIREQRIPRTLLAALVGAALGVAGAVMQGLTRNPLADPGILGVNAGAYFAMVLGSVLVGAAGTDYLWWSLGGAFVASVLVYFVGSRGIGGASPAKLVLTGVAIASMLSGLAFGLTMIHPRTFDAIRGLLIGTLDGRGWPQLSATWLLVLIGSVGALALSGYLNALALGDDRANALGVPVTAVRAVGFVVVTMLCGAATAAVGPITFVGLMVPHAVRMVVGPDHRWMIPLCLVVGPIVLVGSDLIARVATSSELPVGMVTAFLGAPVLIWLASRAKGAQW